MITNSAVICTDSANSHQTGGDDGYMPLQYLPTQGNDESPEEGLFRMKFDHRLRDAGRLLMNAERVSVTYDELIIENGIRKWRYIEMRNFELFKQWFPNCVHGINGILVDPTGYGLYKVIDGKVRAQILKELSSMAAHGDFDYSQHKEWIRSTLHENMWKRVNVNICPEKLSESDKKLLPLVAIRMNATTSGCNVIEAIRIVRDIADQFGVCLLADKGYKRLQSKAQVLIQHTMFSLGFSVEFIAGAMSGLKALVKLPDRAFETFDRILKALIDGSQLEFSNERDESFLMELGIATTDCPYNEITDIRRLDGTDSATEFWNEVPKLFLRLCDDKPLWSKAESNIFNVFLKYGEWSFYHTLLECHILLILHDNHTDRNSWFHYQKFYTYSNTAIHHYEEKRKTWPLVSALPSYFVVKQHRFHTVGTFRHAFTSLPEIREVFELIAKPVQVISQQNSNIPMDLLNNTISTTSARHVVDSEQLPSTVNVAGYKRKSWNRVGSKKTKPDEKSITSVNDVLMRNFMGDPITDEAIVPQVNAIVPQVTAIVPQVNAAQKTVVISDVVTEPTVFANSVKKHPLRAAQSEQVSVDGGFVKKDTMDATIMTNITLDFTGGEILPADVFNTARSRAINISFVNKLTERDCSVTIFIPINYVQLESWRGMFRLNVRISSHLTLTESPVYVAMVVVPFARLTAHDLSEFQGEQNFTRNANALLKDKDFSVSLFDPGCDELVDVLHRLYRDTRFVGDDSDILQSLYHV